MNCHTDIFTGSTGKRIDDFDDIWNFSEPKYEEFALDDSVNGRMTSFKNSTGNQNDSIPPASKQRCSLSTEYSNDINRQLICSSNVTQRKPIVTSTLSNIRSKEIMEQLNAALSLKETVPITEATVSPPTNTSPSKVGRITELDQRSLRCKRKLLLIYVFDILFTLVFSIMFLLFLALLMPDQICLNQEIAECFHKGESQISFKEFLLQLINPDNQCSIYKLCCLFYNSLMGLI